MLHHGNDNYNIILISKYEVDLRLFDRRLADVDIRLVSMHLETTQRILLHGYQFVENQQNSKSNKLIKMTRAFQPYLTFTGEPPGWRPNCPQVGDLTANKIPKATN